MSDGEFRVADESRLHTSYVMIEIPSTPYRHLIFFMYNSFMKKFTRTIEDFSCGHCGREVTGNGYTNHCPACLWSKHVDKNPGDRLEACGGMMEPVGAEKEGKDYMIHHRCMICGFQRRNSLRPEDSFDVFVEISRKAGSKL